MRILSILMSFALFMPTGIAGQKFPSLEVDHSLLERAQAMKVSLTEARQAFERAITESSDPRSTVIHTRAFFLVVLMFRNNLASRYHQRADAPVSPPISAAEAQRLRNFIQDLMALEATLLALEETALRQVAKQYPALENNGALAQWHRHNQNMRQRLAERSIRTGLSVKQFPHIRWEDRRRVVEQAQRVLQQCEYVPATFSENGDLLQAEVIKLPQELKRFATAPLPWSKEENAPN